MKKLYPTDVFIGGIDFLLFSYYLNFILKFIWGACISRDQSFSLHV